MTVGTTALPTIKPPAFPARRIDQSIGPATGHIRYQGNLSITGDIADMMRVKCRGSLEVERLIQAATVWSGADIDAVGGISARHKGHCLVAGNLSARYLRNANVHAGGDVAVQTEISSSIVVCGGSVRAINAHILGGKVMAGGSVHCRELGGRASIATLIEAGSGSALHELARLAIAEIKRLREKQKRAELRAKQILADVGPLPAAAKQRAAALLSHCGKMEQLIQHIIAMLRQLYEQATAITRWDIRVSGVVHPGITVRFPGLEATVGSALQGPLKFFPGAPGRGIVASDDHGSSFGLVTRAVQNQPRDLARLIASL